MAHSYVCCYIHYIFSTKILNGRKDMGHSASAFPMLIKPLSISGTRKNTIKPGHFRKNIWRFWKSTGLNMMSGMFGDSSVQSSLAGLLMILSYSFSHQWIGGLLSDIPGGMLNGGKGPFYLLIGDTWVYSQFWSPAWFPDKFSLNYFVVFYENNRHYLVKRRRYGKK